MKVTHWTAVSAVVIMGFNNAHAVDATANPPTTNSDTAGLDEIVVTSRRVAENLQVVPVSVTAFSGNEITSLGANNIADISAFTPNLTATPGIASKNAGILSIRGLVQTNNIFTIDPAVGVYIDDVYYARSYSVLSNLVDVSDVEVLNGPQGTLYGRNTLGGAVKITTAKPDANAGYTGFVQGGYGNLDAKNFSGAINLPLIPGALAVRVSGEYRNDNGYTHSYLVPNVNGLATSLTPIADIHTDNNNNYSGRVSIRWTPSSAVTVDLTGSFFKANDNGGLIASVPGDIQNYPPIFLPGVLPNGTASVFSNSPQRQASFYAALTSYVPFDLTVLKTSNATLQWDMTPALTSKLILGVVQSSNDSAQNSGGEVNGGLVFLEIQPDLTQYAHQFSAEYQLLGHALNDRLSFIGGLYYFNETGGESEQGSHTLLFNESIETNYAGHGCCASRQIGQNT